MRRPASYSSSLAAVVRRRFHLSQAELGDYLGVSAEQVAHAEAGRYGLSAPVQERLGRLARLPAPAPPPAGAALPLPAASPAETAHWRARLRRCRHVARQLQAKQAAWPAQDAALVQRRQALAALRAALVAAPAPNPAYLPLPDDIWLAHLEHLTGRALRHRPSAAARTVVALRLRLLEEEAAGLAALLGTEVPDGTE